MPEGAKKIKRLTSKTEAKKINFQEMKGNFLAIIKNKKDEKYLFKTKGPSKKIAESIGLKDCKSKHSEGCYVHYSSRVAFGG